MSDEKLARNPLAQPADEIYAGDSVVTSPTKAKRRVNRDVVLATFSLYLYLHDKVRVVIDFTR